MQVRPLFRDLSYGFRTLQRSPGFTISTLLMLAIGLGVNATVFSWIQAVILNPLAGVYRPSRLVTVIPSYGGNFTSSTLSYPDFRYFHQVQTFPSATIFISTWPHSLSSQR